MRHYDYLIVGAGLFGAVFTYKAMQQGKKCLVIDRRPHIGGNLYCENVEGINVHKYGAHIFHTSNKGVWEFVNSIVEFNRYTNSPVANYKGKLYNLPFNMNTFYQMWGVTTPAEAKAKIEEQKAEAVARMKADGVTEPRNLEEQAQTLIGKGISSGSAQTTGKTDSMQFHTGRVAGTDGNTAVQYRYIENPWGNYWEWLDGYNEISRVPYVCWDRDNYQSDVTTGYTKIYDGWSSNIYGQGIKSTIINEDMPWCDGIPKEKGGSDTTYIPDYMDVGNSGNHVAHVSGHWSNGSRCGLWYFNAYDSSGSTLSIVGSRLSYKEPSAAYALFEKGCRGKSLVPAFL